ncbi:NlpC/P60 family protein [Fastidiosibacter lacustris]|uniref:NlpC/P60 family protein n=1 Tax=Fastidiosibacter lacustris TaxID=2056695 RepID=UPI000E3535A7|nr:NlpC/P60 family protein [Fastidiosibacter lacustris]
MRYRYLFATLALSILICVNSVQNSPLSDYTDHPVLSNALRLKEIADTENLHDFNFLKDLSKDYDCHNYTVVLKTIEKIKADNYWLKQVYQHVDFPYENISLKDIRKYIGYDNYKGIFDDAIDLLNSTCTNDSVYSTNLLKTSPKVFLVSKVTMIYMVFELSENISDIFQSLNLSYPITIKSNALKKLLHPVALYDHKKHQFNLLNSGYVWGGNFKDENNFKGTDCSGFVQYSTQSQVNRMITKMLELSWKKQVYGLNVDEKIQYTQLQSWSNVDILDQELEAKNITENTFASEIKLGDLIAIPGHVMIAMDYPVSANNTLSIIHCTRKEDDSQNGINIAEWSWSHGNDNVWILRPRINTNASIINSNSTKTEL